MTHHTAEHRSRVTNDCILACTQCEATCLETTNHCLGEGGEHAAPDHISLMQACADICGASARTMLRSAGVDTVVCRACAEVCRQCAASCERMGDDAEMKRCAEACRRCAEACTAMA